MTIYKTLIAGLVLLSTLTHISDTHAVEKFGVPVDRFLGMIDDDGVNVDVREAYQVYEMFLRFHEMNNLFVSKFPVPRGSGEDI